MSFIQFFTNDVSPITEDFVLSKGALSPAVQVQLLDLFDPAVDLTGFAITFSMENEDGVAKITNVAATLVDGPNAKVEYQWAGTDTDTENRFFGQFKFVKGAETFLVPNNLDQKLRIIIGPAI